ncbi:MAG TPA: hypothetical protein VE973_01120 [Candidatus Limnocylindria bacterium]|nr:hypothetical protein [Candidatus Limnocylindria bacterium]
MQLNFFSYKAKVIYSSLLVAVILFLAIFLGISSGKTSAQSQTVVKAAQNLAQGLKYFYQDQSRYPTLLEFSDKNIMLSYFSSFPPQDFVSGNCPQSFIYKIIGVSITQLDYCLPKGSGQYAAGWNKIIVQQ